MGSFKDVLGKNSGYTAFEAKEKEYEENKKNFVNRFWLKDGATAKIVFLDDEPPIIEEHQLKIDGDWRNWFTCLRMVGDACPICDKMAKNKPYTAGFYTVIDMTEWTDSKDKTHKNELKLFVAKFKTLQVLRRLSSKRGSLAGCVFEVFRSSSDAPNTGDVFEFERKLSKAEILELNKDAKPFDYATILEPRSAAEIMGTLKKAAQRSNDQDNADSSEDEDIQW